MVKAILGLVGFTYKKERPTFSNEYLTRIGKKAIDYFPKDLFTGYKFIERQEYDDSYIVKQRGLDFVDVNSLIATLKKYDNGQYYRIAGLVEGVLILDDMHVGGYASEKFAIASLKWGLFYTEVDSCGLARTLTLVDELGHTFGLKHPPEILERASTLEPQMGYPRKVYDHENFCLMLFNSTNFCDMCRRKLKRAH